MLPTPTSDIQATIAGKKDRNSKPSDELQIHITLNRNDKDYSANTFKRKEKSEVTFDTSAQLLSYGERSPGHGHSHTHTTGSAHGRDQYTHGQSVYHNPRAMVHIEPKGSSYYPYYRSHTEQPTEEDLATIAFVTARKISPREFTKAAQLSRITPYTHKPDTSTPDAPIDKYFKASSGKIPKPKTTNSYINSQINSRAYKGASPGTTLSSSKTHAPLYTLNKDTHSMSLLTGTSEQSRRQKLAEKKLRKTIRQDATKEVLRETLAQIVAESRHNYTPPRHSHGAMNSAGYIPQSSSINLEGIGPRGNYVPCNLLWPTRSSSDMGKTSSRQNMKVTIKRCPKVCPKTESPPPNVVHYQELRKGSQILKAFRNLTDATYATVDSDCKVRRGVNLVALDLGPNGPGPNGRQHGGDDTAAFVKRGSRGQTYRVSSDVSDFLRGVHSDLDIKDHELMQTPNMDHLYRVKRLEDLITDLRHELSGIKFEHIHGADLERYTALCKKMQILTQLLGDMKANYPKVYPGINLVDGYNILDNWQFCNSPHMLPKENYSQLFENEQANNMPIFPIEEVSARQEEKAAAAYNMKLASLAYHRQAMCKERMPSHRIKSKSKVVQCPSYATLSQGIYLDRVLPTAKQAPNSAEDHSQKSDAKTSQKLEMLSKKYLENNDELHSYIMELLSRSVDTSRRLPRTEERHRGCKSADFVQYSPSVLADREKTCVRVKIPRVVPSKENVEVESPCSPCQVELVDESYCPAEATPKRVRKAEAKTKVQWATQEKTEKSSKTIDLCRCMHVGRCKDKGETRPHTQLSRQVYKAYCKLDKSSKTQQTIKSSRKSNTLSKTYEGQSDQLSGLTDPGTPSPLITVRANVPQSEHSAHLHMPKEHKCSNKQRLSSKNQTVIKEGVKVSQMRIVSTSTHTPRDHMPTADAPPLFKVESMTTRISSCSIVRSSQQPAQRPSCSTKETQYDLERLCNSVATQETQVELPKIRNSYVQVQMDRVQLPMNTTDQQSQTSTTGLDVVASCNSLDPQLQSSGCKSKQCSKRTGKEAAASTRVSTPRAPAKAVSALAVSCGASSSRSANKTASTICLLCADQQIPTIKTNLLGAILKIAGKHKPSDLVLLLNLHDDERYHINVSLRKTGKSLACRLVTDDCMLHANERKMFDDFLTFFVVESGNTAKQKNKIISHTFEFIKC